VQCEGGLLELVAPPFTSSHDPAVLAVTPNSSGDSVQAGARVETFAPVDAYQLMVEAVSARICGSDA
jgi:hypothetical protein